MASLGMGSESYVFKQSVIEEVITKKSAGNYALGYINEKERFVVKYVGRSDLDLKTRLEQHLDENPLFECFKFKYATSPKNAFERECINYHDFKNTILNEIHPDRPNNSKNWDCPCCDKFSV